MSREIIERPTTMRIAIHLCDRCGREIPTGRVRGTEEGLMEGAGLSARGGGEWQPLVPVKDERGTHSPEYHAANVDICQSCLDELREWFSVVSYQDRDPASELDSLDVAHARGYRDGVRNEQARQRAEQNQDSERP